MSKLLTRLKGSARTLIVVAGIAIIPVIYSGSLILANQDPTHNLDSVPAAVVNLDKPSPLGDETLDLGKRLSEELTASSSHTNFDWTALSEEEAASALDSGDVLAVLTIPEDFSANASSVADEDPSKAVTAGLTIRTNDGANMVAGTIATSIGSAVRTSLASELSEEYLRNIYVGFTTVHNKVAEAADGADALTEGAITAEQGASQLVVGLDELADGSALLADGSASLASGATQASKGANTLASGLSTLAIKTAALPGQATQLASGAQEASTGAAALSESLNQLAAGATKIANGDAAALTGATSLQGGLTSLAVQTPNLATGTTKLSSALDALASGHTTMTPDELDEALKSLSENAATVSTAAATVDASVATLAAGADTLVGSVETNTGLATLSPSASTVASGAAKAATGAAALDTGVATIATGTSALSDQVPQLVSAIGSAATGAASLSEGTSALATGASTLSTKTGALAVGSLKARDGGEQLDSGLADLEAGENTLSGGLHDGLNDIPSYTSDEADHLSSVTAAPVSIDTAREHEVPAYGYGLAPYFLALALWVGALAFYLMMPPLSRRAVAGRGPIIVVALRSYLPGFVIGIVQSALAVLVVTRVIGLEPVNTWGLFGMMALTSVTFVAMNQALVALLGAPGRFIGLMMIVLQLSAAGGTYPIQTAPSFFQTIHSWLPLTYAVESFRSLIAGGTIGLGEGVWVLVAWLVGALLVTTLAAFRSRRSFAKEQPDLPLAEQAASEEPHNDGPAPQAGQITAAGPERSPTPQSQSDSASNGPVEAEPANR